MGSADAALAAFTIFNLVRLFAYLPQILKIRADRNGAAAISLTTWTMFALSHLSTAAYALFATRDAVLGGIFLLNAAGCFAIVGAALHQRGVHRETLTRAAPLPALASARAA